MHVVIWARVSSREQREGYSIDAQLRANRETAEQNGWTVVREFVVAESAIAAHDGADVAAQDCRFFGTVHALNLEGVPRH